MAPKSSIKRLRVGIDGNAIFCGRGFMPFGEFVFEELPYWMSDEQVEHQAERIVEKWHKEFPQFGRLEWYWEGKKKMGEHYGPTQDRIEAYRAFDISPLSAILLAIFFGLSIVTAITGVLKLAGAM